MRSVRDCARALRVGGWWTFIPPVMMAVAYWQLVVDRPTVSAGKALATAALFLATTFGIAAIGFLLNDLGDRDSDRAGGSANAALTLGPQRTAGLLGAMVALAVVPWLFLHPRPVTIALLGAELALFVLYSLPPARLKVRGFAGPLADGAYAYTIPMLVSAFVFGDLGHGGPRPLPVVLLGAWGQALGLRQYLGHQLADAGADERTGTATFVLRFGWSRSFTLLTMGVFPIELALFIAVIVTASSHAPEVGLGLIVWLLVWRWRERPLNLLADGLRGLSPITRFTVAADRVIGPFIVDWLPLLLLVALVLRRPGYATLAALHLVVFRRQLGLGAKAVWRRLAVVP